MRWANRYSKFLLLLRTVLIVRCLLDLAFAWRVQGVADPSGIDLADVFAPFSLLDGIAALMVAIVGFPARLPPSIVLLAAADGTLRIAASAALHFGPGIPYFPVTAVLYVGVLAALGVAFGIGEEVAARQIEHEGGWNRLSIALAIAGAATVALGVTEFALLHSPRAFANLLTSGLAMQAMTMLAIAAGARQEPSELASTSVNQAATSGVRARRAS